jgi:PEP-CTERM motif-containing protein
MTSILRRVIPLALCLLLLAVAAKAQTENVGTSSSATASYGTTFQSAGPFPWSDLGITASASVTPGVLNVNTGGSTAFTLNSTVTGNETFIPGATVLNLGYTPSWTGDFNAAPPASGNFNSKFVYNIGPFSGSNTILNAPLSIPSVSAPLDSNLNFNTPAVASQAVNGPGASLGVGLQAQVCFIVCATVASASLNFNVGTQIQQTVSAQPNVTYGDLVWYSTTPTFSNLDKPFFVAGGGGTISNVFDGSAADMASLATLGALSNGETIYYNFLPAIQLAMPVGNDAAVSVPASITAMWNIFGFKGSQNFPLGNLYTLDTGVESFNYDANFYGGDFYSVPLDVTAFCGIACFLGFETPPSGSTVNLIAGGGIPGNTPPSINITSGGGSVTGYGIPNMGPLFPNGACPPGVAPGGPDCATQITTQFSGPTPEPGTLLLLGSALAALGAAKRKLLLA